MDDLGSKLWAKEADHPLLIAHTVECLGNLDHTWKFGGMIKAVENRLRLLRIQQSFNLEPPIDFLAFKGALVDVQVEQFSLLWLVVEFVKICLVIHHFKYCF